MRAPFLPLSCLLSFFLAAGCGPQPLADGGQLQDAGLVVEDAGTAPSDAGLPDAGALAVDAGLADAGSHDAGAPDAGCVCALPRYCNASEQCVADATPPRVTVTASAGTTSSSLRVSGTATDMETGVSAVEVRVGTAGAVTVAVNNGTFDAQIPVPAGARYEFRVEVKARDAAGNETTAQTVFDTLAPALTITPNQAGVCTSTGCTGAFIDAATSSFTVTADVVESVALATSGAVQVRITATGGSVVVPWTDLTASGTGAWSWTWTALPSLDFTQMLVEVAATDAAGNRATASVGLLFDRVRPSLSFSPSQDAACTAAACTGTVVNLATPSLEFLGVTSSDAAVRLRVLDGASVVVAPVAVPVTSGSWTYSWTGFPSVDGRFYAVELTATDTLQNTTTRQVVVLVDRVLPSLLVNSPRQGTLVGSPQVVVNASASDGHGVRAVEAGTTATGPWVGGAPDVNGDYVASVAVPVVDAVEQTLTVRAIDRVGNTRTATTRYTADRVAPQLTIAGVDADCSGPTCTGSVANRASTDVTYTGTASDGSAVTLSRTVVGGGQIVGTGNGPLVGTSWSWSWGTLPSNINGVEYELRVVATDAAGNQSATRVRKTWLDNVAPVFTIPVQGSTTVGISAVLVTASEPMNVASVQAAVSFSPAVSMGSFGAVDGRNYSFSASPLLPYSRYTIALQSAQDKAGNPSLGTLSGAFTTVAATFPNPRTVLSPPNDGSTLRLPSVVVDADGRATIAFSRDTGGLVEAYVRHDVGTGSVSVHGPLYQGHTVLTPTSLSQTSATRQSDGRLVTTADLGFVMTDGTSSSLAYAEFTSTPGAGTESNALSPLTVVGGTRSTPRTELQLVRPTVEYFQGPSITGQLYSVRFAVSPNVGANAMLSWESSSSGWSSSSPSTLVSLGSLGGRASVETPTALGPSRVRFFEFGSKSEVFSGNFIRAATAPPSMKQTVRFMLATVSASYVAWTTDTVLSVACSASPFATSPVWQTSTVTLPSRTAGSPLSSAMTQSLVVVAGEYGGNVVVYSTPQQTGCGAPPVLTQVGVIAGAREPGVHIDAAGRIWVATVTAAGGIQLNQF